MDKIICLVGESGSGKTTLCKELEKEGYNIIKSYTTRKPRYAGEYGHTFVDKDDKVYSKMHDVFLNKSIAYTFYDNEHYWATKEQYENKSVSIYVIDPYGVAQLRESVKDAEIIVIYLRCSRQERYNRMKNRQIFYEGKNRKFAMNEAMSRILHDELKFNSIKCDYAVNADRNIRDILADIRRIIEG
ncbi:MAG: AAA family ATPase [Bacillota bacterium]|nr:AAA family ATPase [Bacillota bacterium]